MVKNKLRNIVIDFGLLEKHDLSINELITLIMIEFSNNGDYLNYTDAYEDYSSLIDKKLIKVIHHEDKIEFILRTKAKLIVNSSLQDIQIIEDVDTKGVIKRSDRELTRMIEEGIDSFRKLFKGLKPGAMGSKFNCKTKLRRWMIENPEYTIEDILKATKIYINSLNDSYTYLQQADYFIYKRENNSKEESSRLSAFIEEIDDSDFTEKGWTNSLI